MAGFTGRLRDWARSLKKEIRVLWFAVRDPETPWYARLLGLVIVGCAISPIDLIPDFIPLLGYLDDIILLPLGLALLRRLIPEAVMEKARRRVEDEAPKGRLRSRTAGLVVIGIWLVAASLVILCLLGTGR